MTFEEWLKLNTPRNRAYSVVDLRTGWDAALETHNMLNRYTIGCPEPGESDSDGGECD